MFYNTIFKQRYSRLRYMQLVRIKGLVYTGAGWLCRVGEFKTLLAKKLISSNILVNKKNPLDDSSKPTCTPYFELQSENTQDLVGNYVNNRWTSPQRQAASSQTCRIWNKTEKLKFNPSRKQINGIFVSIQMTSWILYMGLRDYVFFCSLYYIYRFTRSLNIHIHKVECAATLISTTFQWNSNLLQWVKTGPIPMLFSKNQSHCSKIGTLLERLHSANLIFKCQNF